MTAAIWSNAYAPTLRDVTYKSIQITQEFENLLGRNVDLVDKAKLLPHVSGIAKII